MEKRPNLTNSENTLIDCIKSIISNSRKIVSKAVNQELIITYWKIGEQIVSNEQSEKLNTKSANQVIQKLSKELTNELGRGFSRSNLFNMRKFHLEYKSIQTLSGQLSWSHICELLIIDNTEKREFYQTEITNSKWSIRELKRQVDSSLYERLLLSSGKANKEKVIELSKKGQELNKPEDIIKSPYVFEFLGIPENKPLLEKELEYKLVRHIEDFLLELGKGFMFVGTQQRVTINNTHYYVDMVFYNKILKSYILIELKTTKLNISDGGQLNTYLNYYKTEINDENDNPPIGIILCTEKDEITAEYILGGFENNLFASKYILPNKEELIKELEEIMQSEK
jgi:predicted nuclease of restriction endonuclease-like (RecB) superfamily